MPPRTSLTIFKTGQHVDSQGHTFSVDRDTLQKLAETYRPEQHEAPLVIGHPQNDAPAYGWVKSLKMSNDCLVADIGQLHPDVERMVESGAFRKLSASFYPADSHLNPTPGALSLRHVGLLGAQPPAIKGLPNIQFEENNSAIINWSTEVPGGVWQRLARWLQLRLDRQSLLEMQKLWAEESPAMENTTQESAGVSSGDPGTSDSEPTENHDWAPQVQRIAASLPEKWDQHTLRQYIDRLQQLLQPENSPSVQFSELSAPVSIPANNDVSALIAGARALVNDAQSRGLGLNFAEAVTLAQQEKPHAK